MSQFSPLAMNTRIIISFLVAILFTTIPLPDVIENYRPLFVPLTVLYWVIFHPLSFGLGKAFIAGLVLEASQTLVIGQAALGLICITVFALANHRRIQLSALPQQMLTIAFLLLVYQFSQVWIESMLGRPTDYTARTFSIVISALIWPGIIVFIGSVILKQKTQQRN